MQKNRILFLSLCVVLLGAPPQALAQAERVSYQYDQLGRLIRVDYGGGKTITYTYDKNGNLLSRVVASGGPVFAAAGVVNAASFQGGPVAAGEIVTIFGSGIGPPALAGLRLTPGGLVDNSLAETRVLFDDVAAPLIYVSAAQTSAVVPYAVAGKASTQVQIEYRGIKSAAVSLPVAASAPGIFTVESTGRGQGAILNQDGSVNGAANRAAKGSVVVLFCTGEGQTDPPGVDGKLAGDVLPKPRLPVSVRIGGLPAEVLYAGAAPGLVGGVLQVNVKLPEGMASGTAVPVLLTIGDATSPAGVTLAVQ